MADQFVNPQSNQQNQVPTNDLGQQFVQGSLPVQPPQPFATDSYPLQASGGVPVQDYAGQMSGTVSPEVPVQPMQSEAYTAPEQTEVNSGKSAESIRQEQKSVIQQKKNEIKPDAAKENKQNSEQTFENQYKLYGYIPSNNFLSKNRPSSNPSGDVYSAKTWLLILLQRLLRMHEAGGIKTA